MKVTKLLTVAAAVLLATLVVQVNPQRHTQPRSHSVTFALWKFAPEEFAKAVSLADSVVQAHVQSVQPGAPDIFCERRALPGEGHDGEDKVCYDRVTLAVTKIRGIGDPNTIAEIERIGEGSLAVPGPIGPLQNWPLEDNPPYQKDQDYVLFIRYCPKGDPKGMPIVMGPTGRFFVVGGRVFPVVSADRMPWVREFVNMSLAEFVQRIIAGK